MGASLQGQVAVVTGASSGLGAHFARVLASEGAAVALTARRLDKVEAIAGELAGQGHRAMALRLDVADAASIGPAFDEVEAALG
ncbi:MAG: SDR family NAD(P)-dependent oxidoreductase, partial [Phenylobacterium sp.]